MKIKKQLTLKQLRTALLDIPDIEITSYHPKQSLVQMKFVTAKSKYFMIRLRIFDFRKFLDLDPKLYEFENKPYYLLELGVRDCFDKWSNSVNFVQKIPIYCYRPIILDFNGAIKQAYRVVESHAFDWDRYFDKIQLNDGYRYEKESVYK